MVRENEYGTKPSTSPARRAGKGGRWVVPLAAAGTWPYRLAATPASHVRARHFRARPTEPPKRRETAALAKNGREQNNKKGTNCARAGPATTPAGLQQCRGREPRGQAGLALFRNVRKSSRKRRCKQRLRGGVTSLFTNDRFWNIGHETTPFARSLYAGASTKDGRIASLVRRAPGQARRVSGQPLFRGYRLNGNAGLDTCM